MVFSHKRQAVLTKANTNLSVIIIGDSIATGLIRYNIICYEYFNQDVFNRGIGSDNIQIFLCRSKNIPLTQPLCYEQSKNGWPWKKNQPSSHKIHRKKLLKSEPIITEKYAIYKNIHSLKPDTDCLYEDGYLNKIFFYKDNLHLGL